MNGRCPLCGRRWKNCDCREVDLTTIANAQLRENEVSAARREVRAVKNHRLATRRLADRHARDIALAAEVDTKETYKLLPTGELEILAVGLNVILSGIELGMDDIAVRDASLAHA